MARALERCREASDRPEENGKGSPVSGDSRDRVASLSGRGIRDILKRVENGASLYMSLNTALLSPFKEITGVEVIRRSQRAQMDSLVIDGVKVDGLGSGFRCEFAPAGAEVLLSTEDGNPAFIS